MRITTTFEVRRTPWRDVGKCEAWKTSNVQAYRIWVAFDGLRWFQRHEWKYKDEIRENLMENWIASFGNWIDGMEVVELNDE